MLNLLVVALTLGVLLVLFLAPVLRRWRTYRTARTRLAAGDWSAALQLITPLCQPGLNATWQARIRQLQGEAHQLALQAALDAHNFEAALEHAARSAELLALDATEQRQRVIEACLAEVRHLFALGPARSQDLQALLQRAQQLAGSSIPEATFWHALDLARDGQLEQAHDLLLGIHAEVGKQIFDVPLYLGLLLHRLGKPHEALRYLAEANRIDANPPFLAWQMGVSLVASGGDAILAVRLLQRAISSRGLLGWEKQPDRLWIDGLPEGRSYVRRLAVRHPYTCPLLGKDLSLLLRQARLALAQALYRQERFADAAEQYAQLLLQAPPTPLLLRGHGIALARSGQYDSAYRQLRLAFDQESPKDPLTAGYLALCGALGKPANVEDKPRNVQGALRLLARFPLLGSAEWAAILQTVHAEARLIHLEPAQEDLVLLCRALASVGAHDSRAAVAYADLARRFPHAVEPLYAWLYCRAVTLEAGPSICTELFELTFQTQQAARSHFAQQGWDFDLVEFAFLDHASRQHPGHFPAVLGDDYPPRGEAFLLERSQRLESAGQLLLARDCAEVLLRLRPDSAVAYDRLACLHYRAGEIEQAIELLKTWHQRFPSEPLPLVRLAFLQQQRGQAEQRAQAIHTAVERTQGRRKAAVAYLGACLAACSDGEAPSLSALEQAKQLLQQCLKTQPDHQAAESLLAAVLCLQGDREGLTWLAPRMAHKDGSDARHCYLAALCSLEAGDFPQALRLARRAEQAPHLAVESCFLQALILLQADENEAAKPLLERVARHSDTPSAPVAQFLLGQLALRQGRGDEAVTHWSAIEPGLRSRWGIDEILRQTVYWAGLTALREQRYEQAADYFRSSAKLGLRQRSLTELIGVALVKAGQRHLNEHLAKVEPS